MTEIHRGFDPKGQKLNFGSWSIDLRDDEFADIKYRGHSVLRSVRAVVRDRDWNTADLLIDSIAIDETSATISATSIGFGSSFKGRIRAEFKSNAAIFGMEFVSQKEFETNRTGLIVLHEPEVAGHRLCVRHANGQLENTKFPAEISPNQPVYDITALEWQQSEAGGIEGPESVKISIEFDGDIFEMEDQRNWTDASYKTYSRPLALPFPYRVAAGETISQSLTIKVDATSDFVASGEPEKIILSEAGLAPWIQLATSSSPGDTPRYQEFASAQLVELDLQSSNWRAALARAQASGVPLDVRIIYAPDAQNQKSDAELAELVKGLSADSTLRVAIFDANKHVSSQSVQKILREALSANGKNIRQIAGARSHFTELNREQAQILTATANEPAQELDLAGVCFSSTPLFHSLTAAQLLESVAMQRITATQAMKIADGRPLHIGPITLRPRFNNVATAPQPGPSASDLSDGFGAEFTGANDDRQSTAELGAWVIASAAAFAVGGVESITWFEAWGPRGIRDLHGNNYPAADALKLLSTFSGKSQYSGSDSSGEIWALAFDNDGKLEVLAANLRTESVEITLHINGHEKPVKLEPMTWGNFQI